MSQPHSTAPIAVARMPSIITDDDSDHVTLFHANALLHHARIRAIDHDITLSRERAECAAQTDARASARAISHAHCTRLLLDARIAAIDSTMHDLTLALESEISRAHALDDALLKLTRENSNRHSSACA